MAGMIAANTLRRRAETLLQVIEIIDCGDTAETRRQGCKPLKSFAETFCGNIPPDPPMRIRARGGSLVCAAKGSTMTLSTPKVITPSACGEGVITEPQPIGTALMYRGQRYVVYGHRTHRTKDGRDVVLIELTSHCTECGEPFTITALPSASNFNRRCQAHKQPGVRV